MSLTGKTKAGSYKDILQMNNSNSGVDGTLRNVVDGEGTASALNISTQHLILTPNFDHHSTFVVKDVAENAILKADTTNKLVKAGVGQHIVNTQYAYFGVGQDQSQFIAANTHTPLPFQTGTHSKANDLVLFGTGTDPATTFTTAEGANTRASALVPVMWRVPDNITIDEIKHLEGASTATGDTTRMHLMSYTFTSGATACLTSGAVVANTSADNTNAGSEQPYLKDWTIGTSDIDAGKVLLCMFRGDSINSDYSVSVTIKYHLR
tara:strand:+ start:48 stop:842 length:795 start_codon:yes stop_codon:yes gene_type:complete